MKRLFKIITLGCALIGAAGLCSCEREAHNSYAFTLDANAEVKAEVPPDSTHLGTGFNELADYMRQLGMFEYEDFDNEARTIEEAIQKNDEEAKGVFRMRFYSFNKNELGDIYKRAGYLSVSVSAYYILVREDGKQVDSRYLDFEFDFSDLN